MHSNGIRFVQPSMGIHVWHAMEVLHAFVYPGK